MGGARLPAFQFYTGDWVTDPALRRCSKAAKGVWIDVLCLMSECENRGVLSTAGEAWSLDEIAAAIGGDAVENLSCLNELLAKGVARLTERGEVYSKRMVDDEKVRQEKSKAGSKGGSRTQANAKQTGKQTPSKTQADPQAEGQAKRGSPTPTPTPSPEEDSSAAFDEPRLEFEKAWDDSGLTPFRKWTAKRRASFRERWREPDWRDSYRAALERAAASSFCCGGGSTGWRADVDWFLRPDSVTKILEGKYDNADSKRDDTDKSDPSYWLRGVSEEAAARFRGGDVGGGDERPP